MQIHSIPWTLIPEGHAAFLHCSLDHRLEANLPDSCLGTHPWEAHRWLIKMISSIQAAYIESHQGKQHSATRCDLPLHGLWQRPITSV